MDNEFELFIPEVQIYGGVFIIDEEPGLYILNGDKIIDGIPIFNDFDEEEEDIYLLLDDNEMVLVGVEIFDINFKEVTPDYITDENYDELIYKLTPLKMHTLETSGVNMIDILDNDLLEDLIIDVSTKYKKVLTKSNIV